MPRSITTVWALNDVAGQQELRQKGPPAMLPCSPQLRYIYKPLVPLLGGTIGATLSFEDKITNLYLPLYLG